MPELPEVETVRTGLEKILAGRKIVRAKVFRSGLRNPFPEKLESTLAGFEVASVGRRAKYLVVSEKNGKPSLVIHLGMSGKITAVPSGEWPGPKKHDHFMMETDNGYVIVLNDPRRFGTVLLSDEPENHPSLKNLGPEPLDESFGAEELLSQLKKTKRPLKTALLDQRVVAGLGNIYICEALYISRLSPFKVSSTLTFEEAGRLVPAIRDVLLRAIEAGGSTLRDYARLDGESGYFQFSFSVYDKEGERCPGCTCDPDKTGGIRRTVQGGRSTFYCPVKQGD
jgi:formamidopyrimidine-DNA glycosylase